MIRLAASSDAASIAEILRPAIVERASSFELIPPDAEEMTRRVLAVQERHPWLVCERSGAVCGYAYGSVHRARPAYRWTVETSVYVAPDVQRKGVGRRLYRALLDALAYQGFRTAVAGVTVPNDASVALHRDAGFEPVGVFRNMGYKFDAWHDVAWFQRPLGDYLDVREPRLLPDVLTDPAFIEILASADADLS